MTACRQSPPEAMLADTLSAKTCCQRCSTATSGDHPGQRRWVCVSKNRPRACLTTFRRRVHSRPVLGDHLQLSHGRGWCLMTGGRRAMLAGVLDSVVSRKCSAGDAGWWRVVEYIVRLPLCESCAGGDLLRVDGVLYDAHERIWDEVSQRCERIRSHMMRHLPSVISTAMSRNPL